MKLSELEKAWYAIKCVETLGTSLASEYRRLKVPPDVQSLVKQLFDDGQLLVLLDLKHAERRLLLALEKITMDTEYLRSALEEQLVSIDVLINKIEREEALRRDRDALHAVPPEGLLEWVGKETP